MYSMMRNRRSNAINTEYVVQTEDGYWVSGSRVSLDSIVYAFLAGQTAESIAQSFPVLTLEQVYGAIAFYLSDGESIDAYLARTEADFEETRRTSHESDPMFYQKLADARQHKQAIGQ
jgi:uncharacterized protein (DUF433 family)